MAKPTKGVNPFAKKAKQTDPTKPFPAPPTKKKAVGKVDVVLTKGVAPKKKVVKKVNAKK